MNCTNLFLGLLLACEMGRVNVLNSNGKRMFGNVRIRLGGDVMVMYWVWGRFCFVNVCFLLVVCGGERGLVF